MGDIRKLYRSLSFIQGPKKIIQLFTIYFQCISIMYTTFQDPQNFTYTEKTTNCLFEVLRFKFLHSMLSMINRDNADR